MNETSVLSFFITFPAKTVGRVFSLSRRTPKTLVVFSRPSARGMIFRDMLGLICYYKIFDSVIISNPIDMVNHLGFLKRSTKVLFHKVSVIQHSLTSFFVKNVLIPRFELMDLTLFKIRPVWRNIINISMSPFSSSMFRAIVAPSFNYCLTAWYFTKFSSSHRKDYI